MPPNAPEASGGDAAEVSEAAGTPRRRLAEIRAEQLHADSELREQIMVAALQVSGELGYRKLTVQKVLERYGGHRVQFYSHFANVGACYATAYATHAGRLRDELLKAGAAQPSWRAGLRAALRELAAFACESPLLARGLLIEAHVAGPPTLGHREEVLERLSRALDSARREIGSRHSPPPLTAPFMVSAIDAAVVSALAKGEPQRFAAAAPELEQMISAAYFGRGIGARA
jgi:AcrR family transcriptional regulator